jgi:flagellin
MSRINTNINSLIAQRVSGIQQKALSKSLERLSTGLRINSGADDPAGLIASEKLRSEKTKISAAIGNAERADQVVGIAEGGLSEVSGLLTEIQNLVSQSSNDAGISTEEKTANQQQIDQILQTIDRIASTTSFQGVKLLNGGFDFNVSSVSANVDGYQVNSVKLPTDGSAVTVKAVVTASAQHGAVFISAGGTALNLSAADEVFSFELAGAKGTRQFTFGSGTTLADVATSINNFKETTGVSAVASGNFLEIKSTDFGSDQFVSFKLLDAGGLSGKIQLASSINEDAASTVGANVTAFVSASAAIRDDGQDVTALINGIAARGKGREVSVNTDALAINLILASGAAQASAGFTALSVNSGGAKFNLGPEADLNNQVIVGLPNVAARNLGTQDVGFLDSLRSGQTNNVINGNVTTGQQVVDKAIDQITTLRARLGSLQNNVIGSSIRSLGIAFENTAAAEATIRDTDFAAQTAELTRSQILVAAANSALGIANAQPQSVLRLIG